MIVKLILEGKEFEVKLNSFDYCTKLDTCPEVGLLVTDNIDGFVELMEKHIQPINTMHFRFKE